MSIKKRYKDQIVEVLKKGKKNTRVKYSDNSTGLVPNEELETIADVPATQPLEAEAPPTPAELPDTNTTGGSAPETEPTPSPESEENQTSWKNDPVTEKQEILVRQLAEKISKNTDVSYAYTKPENKGQAHDLIADQRKVLAQIEMKEEEDRKVLEDIAGPPVKSLSLSEQITANVKEAADKETWDKILSASDRADLFEQGLDKTVDPVATEFTDTPSEKVTKAQEAPETKEVKITPKPAPKKSVPRSRAHLIHEVVNPDPPSPKGALPSHAKRRE